MKIERTFDSKVERDAREVLPSLLSRVRALRIQRVTTELPTKYVSYPELGTLLHRDYRPDMEIVVTVGNEGDDNLPSETPTLWRIYVEVASQVNGRNLQAIAAYAHDVPHAIPLLFVPRLGAAALEACKKFGVCCADAAGNCWITLGGCVYIERTGQKSQTLYEDRSTPPLSAPKTENVLRVLLNALGAPRRVWRLQALATEADVSLGQAARVKNILEQMGVTEETSVSRKVGGFRLTQPEEVLQEWAGYVRARSYHAGNEHSFHAVDTPQELQRMLTRKLPSFVTDRFALSSHQAADFYAPYARSPVFSAYVLPDEEVDMSTLEEAMDLDRVTRGVNVALTVPRDPGVFYLPPDLQAAARDSRLTEGRVPVVSPVQTYLDLLRLGGRAREGGQYLLEKYLRPRWEKETDSDE